MGTIAIKKAEGAPVTRPYEPELEPLRFMRRLLDWDPFREMAPLALEAQAPIFFPKIDVKETKDAFVFMADVPGVKEADLDVTITGNRLTLSGKREAEKEEKTDKQYTYERSFGQFTRVFTLPEGADGENVVAELKEGVLTVTLPKKPELQPKKIAVTAPKS